jgi:hypothetical protein
MIQEQRLIILKAFNILQALQIKKSYMVNGKDIVMKVENIRQTQ